ncbi:helix-turn-helix transcriptional regulator [Halobacillus seohaensis]|uniref:Transcriptional regulator n=1 Tax=Halobacillus seohaensis TaxID=447421 RepID=A0ABW2EPL0_9BACI
MKGQLIKQHRKFKNLTLEDLSSGICSVSYLSKIEHNTINASDEIYRLLGKRLNIRLENLNEDFDEKIYTQLMKWHETIQLKDFPLMKELYKKCQKLLNTNHNIELSNLYKIVHSRYELTINKMPLPKKTSKELHDVLSQSSYEYRFLYYKTIGIHHFLNYDYKKATTHFKLAEEMMGKLPTIDSELYYHFSLAYTRLQMFVESNYYADMALEGYQKSLNYSRITDCHMMLAINYNYLGLHQVAERLFFNLLKGSKEKLSPIENGKIYHNLGYIYFQEESYDQALHYLNEALQLKEEHNVSSVSTLYLLAQTHYRRDNQDSSWKYINKGEREAVKQDELKYQHKFFVLKHLLLETTFQDSFIEKLEKEIIPDFRTLNEYKDYKNHLELLGEICYEKRLYKKCSMLFIEANRYKFTQRKDLL